MKYTVKIIYIILLFFISFPGKIKGENKTDYEKQWKMLGPVNFIDSLTGEYQFSQLDKELFFLKNSTLLNENLNEFWRAVKRKSELNLTGQILNKHRKIYSALILNYIDNRNKKSNEYNALVQHFQQLSSTSTFYGYDSTITNCTNPNFETSSSSHFLGWKAWSGNACYYTSNYICNNFTTPIFPNTSDYLELQTLTSGLPNYDSIVGFNRLPTVAPGGSFSMRLQNLEVGGQASKMTYAFTVDPSNVLYASIFALVLEEPSSGHVNEERPYFEIKVFDSTLNKSIDCLGYRVVADSKDPYFGSSKFLKVSPNSEIKFTNWDSLVMDLSEYVGHYISITYVVSDCALGGHLGYAYIDGACMQQSFELEACVEGKRKLKFKSPIGGNIYWNGPGILGSNYGDEIYINKPGRYTALVNNNTQRCLYQYQFTVTDSNCNPATLPPCNIELHDLNIGECQDSSNLFDINFKLFCSNFGKAKIVKYYFDKIGYTVDLPHSDTSILTIKNLYADGKKHVLKAAVFIGNYISNFNSMCLVTDSIQAPAPCYHPLEFDCKECIGTFAPDTGKIYVLSAWVSQDLTTDTTRTFEFPYVQIEYSGTAVTNPPKFKGKGKIIDGWQRVYEEFKIPTGASQLHVKLGSENGDSYFDDIRIYPLIGSLKSYVYDPVSLRLLAELDENNYATFYEYDQEGILVRTKKETERGIITISENRQSNPKK